MAPLHNGSTALRHMDPMSGVQYWLLFQRPIDPLQKTTTTNTAPAPEHVVVSRYHVTASSPSRLQFASRLCCLRT